MEDIIRQQAQTIARMQQNNEDLMKQLQGAINKKKGDEEIEIKEESSIEIEYNSGQNKNKNEIKSINGSKEYGKHADKRVTERNMSKNGNQMIEQNHEVSQFFNNPDFMRQTMKMIRNLTTQKEIMGNHDKALISLESIPSGYNVQQRIYRDFQEPMLNAAHEKFGDNPQY
ncbi:hypothetical protein GJ496_006354 [Pomphorhynchus laevis]|nr:hypothetical protein GJ496_006354 [Pomphorhynchus laevis]